MSVAINFVWNFLNEISFKSIRYNNKWLSTFDLNNLTKGCSKELGLNSTSIQEVCREYATRRIQFKKAKLRWRTKKSLGWIPFRGDGIEYLGDGKIKYNKKIFKFWETRDVGIIKSGSFNQDSRGRWYINLVVEVDPYHYQKTGKHIGVDLGLKTTATYSDGTTFEGVKSTRKYEKKLAMAQRANKKKQTKKIQEKILFTKKQLDWSKNLTSSQLEMYLQKS